MFEKCLIENARYERDKLYVLNVMFIVGSCSSVRLVSERRLKFVTLPEPFTETVAEKDVNIIVSNLNLNHLLI